LPHPPKSGDGRSSHRTEWLGFERRLKGSLRWVVIVDRILSGGLDAPTNYWIRRRQTALKRCHSRMSKVDLVWLPIAKLTFCDLSWFAQKTSKPSTCPTSATIGVQTS
jgi:hypothetical protein